MRGFCQLFRGRLHPPLSLKQTTYSFDGEESPNETELHLVCDSDSSARVNYFLRTVLYGNTGGNRKRSIGRRTAWRKSEADPTGHRASSRHLDERTRRLHIR